MPTKYFTLEVSGERHTLMRRRGEVGEILEYAHPETGLWIEDTTIFELFIGDDAWSGPDPDLTLGFRNRGCAHRAADSRLTEPAVASRAA